MAGYAEDLQTLDVGVFVVGFDDRRRLDDMKKRLSSPFTFLRDGSRSAYELLDLGRAPLLRTYLHPDVLRPYVGFALQGRFPKLRKHQDRRQLGGDFVVGRDGHVIFAHPEQGPEDRVPVGDLVNAARSAATS